MYKNPHTLELDQARATQYLKWLFDNALNIVNAHPENCTSPQLLRPKNVRTGGDRKGSAIVVERTQNHDGPAYNIKSSGLALNDAKPAMHALASMMNLTPTYEAVDECGNPISFDNQNAYNVIARYENGISFFWTADLGNRINIHCPNKYVFEQITSHFIIPALSP